MRKKKTKRVNKFTSKKHSTRGLIACALAMVSMAALVGALLCAYWPNVTAGIFIGVAGMVSLLLSFIAFGISISAIREENTFNKLPLVGMIFSLLTILCWGGILLLGVLM